MKQRSGFASANIAKAIVAVLLVIRKSGENSSVGLLNANYNDGTSQQKGKQTVESSADSPICVPQENGGR